MVDATLIRRPLFAVTLKEPLLILSKASGTPFCVRECVGRARSPSRRSLCSNAMWCLCLWPRAVFPVPCAGAILKSWRLLLARLGVEES